MAWIKQDELKIIKISQGSLKSYAEKLQKLCENFIENNNEFHKLELCGKEETTEKALISLNNDFGDKSENFVRKYPDKFLLSGEWIQIAKHSFSILLKWVSSLNMNKNVNSTERCILLEDNWPILFVITVCQFNECHDVLKMISMILEIAST
ncbi:hypothetical protein MXB_56 [Myxobolus squamalis]|nr:hypothetical protein MXB_56 [Myxobolus squamalis]